MQRPIKTNQITEQNWLCFLAHWWRSNSSTVSCLSYHRVLYFLICVVKMYGCRVVLKTSSFFPCFQSEWNTPAVLKELLLWEYLGIFPVVPFLPSARLRWRTRRQCACVCERERNGVQNFSVYVGLSYLSVVLRKLCTHHMWSCAAESARVFVLTDHSDVLHKCWFNWVFLCEEGDASRQPA